MRFRVPFKVVHTTGKQGYFGETKPYARAPSRGWWHHTLSTLYFSERKQPYQAWARVLRGAFAWVNLSLYMCVLNGKERHEKDTAISETLTVPSALVSFVVFGQHKTRYSACSCATFLSSQLRLSLVQAHGRSPRSISRAQRWLPTATPASSTKQCKHYHNIVGTL